MEEKLKIAKNRLLYLYSKLSWMAKSYINLKKLNC